jgi:cAMP-dependent protein kinase regulator
MDNASRKEQCLRDAEAYVKEHDIQKLVKDCVVQLCIHRPENPHSFLKQYFATLEKVFQLLSIFFS